LFIEDASENKLTRVFPLIDSILFLPFHFVSRTPDELSLFQDALCLLNIVSSARSEVLPAVSSIAQFATVTRQKIATMQQHMGEMFVFSNNDYVVMNTALLVFIQIIRLMPELLSEKLDKQQTEARLLALEKKLAPVLQECCRGQETHC